MQMEKQKKELIMQKTSVVCLGAMVCCFLWGSAFPCIKIGYSMFHIDGADTGSQILFAGFRFTLAGILTIAAGSLLSRKLLRPKKTSLAKICKLSMLQTVIQYLFFYIGLANTTGVKASIIGSVNVFIAILAASLIFHQERLTRQKIAGCILGICGVVLINLSGAGLESSVSFFGEGFILFSTVAYALSSVFMKGYSKTENPVMLSGYQFLLGGIILTLWGAAAGGQVRGFTLASTALLLYMGVISACAYSLWGILLKYNPVSRVTVFGFMNPMFGVLLSALLLGENDQAFGVKGITALVLVSIGIYVVNRGADAALEGSLQDSP